MQATVIQSIRVGQVIDAIASAAYWRDEPKFRSAIAALVVDGIRVVEVPAADEGCLYDWTQTSESLRDGDVFLFENGTRAGILLEAWPTAVDGDHDALHYLTDGYTWETLDGGKYAAAAAVARKLTSH